MCPEIKSRKKYLRFFEIKIVDPRKINFYICGNMYASGMWLLNTWIILGKPICKVRKENSNHDAIINYCLPKLLKTYVG